MYEPTEEQITALGLELAGIETDWRESGGSAFWFAMPLKDSPAFQAIIRAAQAEVEARVRSVHFPVDVEPSETICAGCSTLRGAGEHARYFPFEEYPCATVLALDPEEAADV